MKTKIRLKHFSSFLCHEKIQLKDVILENINLSIYENSINALIGISGIGKSSMYKSIFRIPPFNYLGDAYFYDEHNQQTLYLNLLTSIEIYNNILGKKIVILEQNPFSVLNPYLSIGEQLIVLLKSKYKIHEIFEKAIHIMNILQLANPRKIFSYIPKQLSGGMLQRVILTMSLLTEPELLIGDEFLSALDINTKEIILKFLCKQKKITILWITHDIYSCLKYSNFINIINANRKLTYTGSKDDFKQILNTDNNVLKFF